MNKNYIAIYKNLGSTLIKRGHIFLRMAHRVKYTRTLTNSELTNALRAAGFKGNVYCCDKKYYVTDIKTMRSIILHSWIDKVKYEADRHDCDDFANNFKAHCSEIYKLNSVAVVRNTKVILSNGKEVYHRHGLFLATDNGVLKVFIIETQNDGVVELIKDVPVVIGAWKYFLGWADC